MTNTPNIQQTLADSIKFVGQGISNVAKFSGSYVTGLPMQKDMPAIANAGIILYAAVHVLNKGVSIPRIVQAGVMSALYSSSSNSTESPTGGIWNNLAPLMMSRMMGGNSLGHGK